MSTDFKHPLVGRQVVYRARHERAKPEQGMVTSVNADAGIVFVNYGRGSTSSATSASDLRTLDGIKVSDFIERGTGRTARQIMEAPDEFWYVVHTHGMILHARDMQRKHAPEKTMDLILCTDVYNRLQGTDGRIPIIVDHAAWEAVDDRTASFIRERNSRYERD